MSTLRVEATEGIFGPTLQGEGINIGMPVSFVRFYGCDGTCSWCDTAFAVPILNNNTGKWEDLEPNEIVEQLDAIGCKNVVLSGGHPLIYQKKLDPLLQILREKGYFIQIETQGSIYPTWDMVKFVSFWSVSPKLPSAGVSMYNNWKAVGYFMDGIREDQVQFKFVISNPDDYQALKMRLKLYPKIKHLPVILQPEGFQLSNEFDLKTYCLALDVLQAEVVNDRYWDSFKTLRVLPQLHKVIWGRERKR